MITTRAIECGGVVCAAAASPRGDQVAVGFAGRNQSIVFCRIDTGASTAVRVDQQAECLAYSPDGARVAAALRSAAVGVYDPATGARVRTVDVPGMPTVTHMTFSGDGRLLALADALGDVSVWDWDQDAPRRLHRYQSRAEFIAGIAFQVADPQCMTIVLDYGYSVWRLGGNAHQARANYFMPNRTTILPDGATIVVARGDSVAKVRVNTHAREYFLEGRIEVYSSAAAIVAVADTPLLAVAFAVDPSPYQFVPPKTPLRVWNMSTGKCVLWEHLDGHCWSLAATPDGRTLVHVSREGRVTSIDVSRLPFGDRVLTLIAATRRRRLPHVPAELWAMVESDFL